ncbi:hypothetical protein K8P63_08035 [Sphingomonas nostoxanthinifaciens]|nr:hypothetical protein K8P63_08035 [Sphingomonas nostoxanthinifaciens]
MVTSAADAGLDPIAANAIADELVELTAILSNLAYDLGDDPDTLRKHMASLQAIDLITQIQMSLADILRSDEPMEKRVAGVGVEALAARLRARLAGLPADYDQASVAEAYLPFE